MGRGIASAPRLKFRDKILNHLRSVSRFLPSTTRHATAGIYVALAILVVLGKGLSISSYFASSYLFQDDTIFVGAAYLGSPISTPQTQSLYYGLIDILTDFGGLPAIKLMLVLMPIVTCVFMFKILRSFTNRSLVAAAISVFVTLYPVSPEQSFFFTGAHPTSGVMLFVIVAYVYLQLLQHQNAWTPIRSGLYFLLCGAGFYAISRTSPAFTLVPLLMLPMAAHALWRDRARLTAFHGVCLIVPAGLFILLFANAGNYHYSALVGWTEISLNRTLANLSASMEYIFRTPFVRHPILMGLSAFSLLVFITAMVALSVRSFHQANWQTRQPAQVFWPFVLFLLLGAALVFGPGSITTNYLDRYVVAPFQIGGLLLGMVVVGLLDQPHANSQRLKVIAPLALFALTAVTLVQSSVVVKQRLSPLLATHDQIVEVLDRREWSNNDQILILLPKGEVESTGGYNHWSTWYLRVLTKTPGLIGLVGNQKYQSDMQANGLFIDTYRDHDPIFWFVEDGVSQRAHMLGLTRDRATYAYTGIDGELTLLPLKLLWQGAEKTLQPGQRFQDAPGNNASLTCDASPPVSRQTFTVNLSTPRRQAPGNASTGLAAPSFVATGQNAEFVDVVEEAARTKSVHFVLAGRPDGPFQPYSKTYPQMPLLAPGFGVYLQGDKYHFQERQGEQQMFTVPVREHLPTVVDIVDCGPGASENALYLNGTLQGKFSNDVIYGRWRLGAGFEDRYWTGEMIWTQTQN
ncbi:MAG: hypothetical protein CME97_11805 [Hyphomonas sp.]|jgi:hypothetical protein|nr:hypothetical protein [Hyphomonas sp.]HCN91954.1 hypothetical protein [Hyphomonas sp.]|tara:strand:+ start:4128 stop:6362 length:2235 start_codon:yes stop_codon:yes gene_type:complete